MEFVVDLRVYKVKMFRSRQFVEFRFGKFQVFLKKQG